MHELTRRLRAHPGAVAELCVATVCINLLALADTIYTMILLRRYIAHGFDGTLALLTIGVLVAVGLQWLLASVRRALAQGLGQERDQALAAGALAALAGAEMSALHAVPREETALAATDLGEIQASCDAQAVCALLDTPFALLFAGCMVFLSPLLAGIVLLGIAAMAMAGRAGLRGLAGQGRALGAARGESRAALAQAFACADTVRVFRGLELCRAAFTAAQERLAGLARAGQGARGASQAVGMGVGVLVRVALYAVGAKLVVDGSLSVAGLIGAVIMGSYALARTAGGVHVAQLVAQAAQAMERLEALGALPREAADGQRPEAFTGAVELRGVAFSFGGPALFSGLDLTLPPGGVLVVRGPNGAGKTTLLRLLAGLLRPTAGEVLADGRPLAGLDSVWWRAQIAWLPQEPFFLPGTVRQNIELACPGLDSAVLRDVVRRARLEHFLDTSEQGVETPVVAAGRMLPVGIRKRLALARTLAAPGRLVLLDEPTAGMDARGAQAVYEAMNAMVRQGRTLVVVSADPDIVKGATLVLDLGAPGAAGGGARPAPPGGGGGAGGRRGGGGGPVLWAPRGGGRGPPPPPPPPPRPPAGAPPGRPRGAAGAPPPPPPPGGEGAP